VSVLSPLHHPRAHLGQTEKLAALLVFQADSSHFVTMEAAGPGAVCQGFKVPSTIPQDLLLIQDLVSPIIAPTKQDLPPATYDDDSVASSGESIDSADEAEAILVSTREDEDEGRFAFHTNNTFICE
jgi:hypothetical protein